MVAVAVLLWIIHLKLLKCKIWLKKKRKRKETCQFLK